MLKGSVSQGSSFTSDSYTQVKKNRPHKEGVGEVTGDLSLTIKSVGVKCGPVSGGFLSELIFVKIFNLSPF